MSSGARLSRFWAPGRLLAVLALLVQIALGGAVPDIVAAQRAALMQDGAICHADGEPSDGPHHAPDHAWCPICGALSVAPAMLLPAPVLPRSGRMVLLRPQAPQSAHRPVAYNAAAFQPRAPPALVSV